MINQTINTTFSWISYQNWHVSGHAQHRNFGGGGLVQDLKELGEQTPKGLLKTGSDTLIGELAKAVKELEEPHKSSF